MFFGVCFCVSCFAFLKVLTTFWVCSFRFWACQEAFAVISVFAFGDLAGAAGGIYGDFGILVFGFGHFWSSVIQDTPS